MIKEYEIKEKLKIYLDNWYINNNITKKQYKIYSKQQEKLYIKRNVKYFYINSIIKKELKN